MLIASALEPTGDSGYKVTSNRDAKKGAAISRHPLVIHCTFSSREVSPELLI